MPFNHRKLEQRLDTCDKKLQGLFTEYQANEALNKRIKAVQAYYNLSYTKASAAKTVESIAASYELFVTQLSKVKQGELKPEEALIKIERANESRKINVLFHNLAKTCESIFWAATSYSLYAAIFGIALPVLIIQPFLGVAVTITIVGAVLAAAYKCYSCWSEFKSLSRHDQEYTNEMHLVSFFKPALREQKEPYDVSLEVGTCCEI